MTTTFPFFSNEETYHMWVQSMPAISRIGEGGDGTFQEEPDEEIAGPYLVAPGSQWLILRDGLSYRVVQRVQPSAKADFAWYVAHTKEAGEKHYAAYLWDARTDPAHIVSGPTLRAARAALDEYLSSPRQQKATKRLFPRMAAGGTDE